MTDRRIIVNPDDAQGRLADMKATAAELGASLELRAYMPRGQAAELDIDELHAALREATTRAFLRDVVGDLDGWRPTGFLGGQP